MGSHREHHSPRTSPNPHSHVTSAEGIFRLAGWERGPHGSQIKGLGKSSRRPTPNGTPAVPSVRRRLAICRIGEFHSASRPQVRSVSRYQPGYSKFEVKGLRFKVRPDRSVQLAISRLWRLGLEAVGS